MARSFNGSSDYLSASSTLLTNEPIGISCFANSGSQTTRQCIVSLGNNGASGFFGLELMGATAGDPVQANKNNDAGSGLVGAATSSGYTAGVWAHATGVFRSDTSRDAYINGGNKGSNTTSRTDPTPDFIAIGAIRQSSASTFLNGSAAEVFIFNYALTDAEVLLLSKGIHPIDAGIPIANIRGWYPLLATDNNSMGGGYPDLSPSGSPAFTSHPPDVIYPRINGLIGF